ncbi:transcriptional repressor [uncultured Aquitalea sp.]|uniref:Fur family transcriptional regulator n=1 Tax=uncultured Aquitalea sp. TaxID=540272 RepID=UPI0025EAA63D|nr:transcriptional repressor [uncultured Aquitalea sp.]
MERRTRQHQAIFDVMTTAERPLLAQEILALASEAVPQLSIATVYRNLKALQDEGTIKPVVLPGQNPRYELASYGHHHHFQCRRCGRVFDFKACPGNLEHLAPTGFTVEEHEIILYGQCRDCVVTKADHSRPLAGC